MQPEVTEISSVLDLVPEHICIGSERVKPVHVVHSFSPPGHGIISENPRVVWVGGASKLILFHHPAMGEISRCKTIPGGLRKQRMNP